MYVIWGSTYLAIRIAVETMPPFLMAASRFLIAGVSLLLLLLLRGVPLPPARLWKHSAIVGTLLLLGGNGLVVWAEQTAPSSLAALIIAITPAWFALLDWVRPGGHRPLPQTIFGIIVGFSGVVLLVSGRDSVHAGELSVLSVIALVTACLLWAAGSLYSKHSPKPENPWMNVAAQMTCGGVALFLVALLRGETSQVRWEAVSERSIAAFLFLVVFGSWIGFSAYVWLLKVSTPAKVSTYAYVNPVIAVFLGWLVLGEQLNTRGIWATVVIVIGVVIITLPPIQTWRLPGRAAHTE